MLLRWQPSSAHPPIHYIVPFFAHAQGPVGKNMGISFLAGLCSAALFKAVARGAAVAFGLVFCSIQLLAMAGIVQVDWVKAGKMVERFTDLNSDGDPCA